MTTIINNKPVGLEVVYAIAGSDDYFSRFEDMIKYWTHYYNSRAELMEKARFEAVVITKGGFPLSSIHAPKACSEEEKKLLMEKAAEYWYGMQTIESV